MEKEDPPPQLLVDPLEAAKSNPQPVDDIVDGPLEVELLAANLILELSARLRLLDRGTAAAQPNCLYVSPSLKPSSIIRPNSLKWVCLG